MIYQRATERATERVTDEEWQDFREAMAIPDNYEESPEEAIYWECQIICNRPLN